MRPGMPCALSGFVRSPTRTTAAAVRHPGDTSLPCSTSPPRQVQARCKPESLEATLSTCQELLDQPLKAGRVELITGPMFAGKSTALVSRVREEQSAGRKVLVIKSVKDTRSSQYVTTHSGDMLDSMTASDLSAFKSEGQSALAYASAEVIAIDEAQFFPDLVEFVLEAADHHHKTVLVAGLDGDFQRRRFGHILDLVPLADSVVKLSAKCQFCERKSLFSFRVVDDKRLELVGGTEKYVPTCRVHYVQLSKAKSEAAMS